MTRNRELNLGLLSLGVCCAVVAAGEPQQKPKRGDWPMLGGRPDRNLVSDEIGIPSTWDVRSGTNIKWTAKLGAPTYGNPVIADGRIFIGTNNSEELREGITGDKGIMLCLDEQTGKLLWQATHDKLESGAVNDWPEQGIPSSPCVEGERLYYVSNRCELVCADVRGFSDGENDGPFKDEIHHDPLDADIVWKLDMIEQLGVFPHNLATSSPLIVENLVFANTSNGVDDSHEHLPSPDAPSFIAVDKSTGKVVWQAKPDQPILHGQWSSPAYDVIAGVPQVVFPGGDGWCYSFEPATGKPLWKFDLNPKDAVWKSGGRGTRNSIVATPVIHENKVYLAAGQDPEGGDGPGMLCAIDATRRGDITESCRVWRVGGRDFNRSISTVAVKDGLVYAVDLSGYLSCFDANTGERHWQYDTEASVWSSPFVVDGKVFIGDEDGEVAVLKHGKVLEVLAVNEMRGSVYSTPVVANGVLYVADRGALYAIAQPTPAGESSGGRPARGSGPEGPATRSAGSQPSDADGPHGGPCDSRGPDDGDWPIFRGNAALTGVAATEVKPPLTVRWKHVLPEPIESSPVIATGCVYIGCDDGYLRSFDLKTGTERWKYKTAGEIKAAPSTIEGTVYVGDDSGVMHAVNAADGTLRWKFVTDGQIISSANRSVDRVLFGSYDGFLYCLRQSDGKLVWKYETEDRVHASPAIAAGNAYVAGCDGELHVVRVSDGKLVRKTELGGPCGASAAVSANTAFVGTYSGHALAVDWMEGKTRWTYTRNDEELPFLASAALADGHVYIAGRDKCIRALDEQTGAVQWELETKGQIDSSPVVAGSNVVFGCTDGRLYVVDRSSGKRVWEFDSGSEITATPAVADGCIVFANLDGVVYCIGPDAEAAKKE